MAGFFAEVSLNFGVFVLDLRGKIVGFDTDALLIVPDIPPDRPHLLEELIARSKNLHGVKLRVVASDIISRPVFPVELGGERARVFRPSDNDNALAIEGISPLSETHQRNWGEIVGEIWPSYSEGL